MACIATHFLKIIFQGIFSAWKEKMPELFEIVTGIRIVVALAIHLWVCILSIFSVHVSATDSIC